MATRRRAVAAVRRVFRRAAPCSARLDGTTFQLGPYGGNNVLLLGSPYASSGTLTLTAPRAYNSLAILATSANGGGNGTFVCTSAMAPIAKPQP